MNDMSDDWEEIGTTSGNRTERRADPDHPLDFFRARSEKGNYMLVLKGDELPSSKKLPVLSGLEISIVHSDSELDELLLELLDSEQKSIFRALVADILLATSDMALGENAAGAARLITRVERWQDLLKRRRNQVLSRQAIIGLFGELHFFRERVLPRMQPTEATASWRGPHGDEQDFVIGGWIIEIKTQLATADQFLKISSEAQLDTSSGPIAICHQTLSPAPSEDPDALTLNEIIADIRNKLLNFGASALDIFEAGLISAGYETRPEYDLESWKPVRATIYEVEDDFPRLIPSNMSVGIRNVTYRILPAACSDYSRNEDWLNETVFND
jgi:hypothetical protein